jgi:hypothetical protein
VLDNYIKFAKAHEKLLLIVLFFGVAGFLGNKYLNASYDAAVAREKSAEQTLASQKEANDKLATQNQQAQQQYSVLLGQINAQNAKLSAEMLQLSQTLAARQKSDAALPAPELALRHENLLGVSSGIQSTENGFLVSPPVEIQTVQSLESLPVIKQQLVDETTLSGDKDKQIVSLGQVVNWQNTEIAGLNSQLVDSDKACDARVSVAKKSRWKYFKAGVAVGAAGTVAIEWVKKHFL